MAASRGRGWRGRSSTRGGGRGHGGRGSRQRRRLRKGDGGRMWAAALPRGGWRAVTEGGKVAARGGGGRG